MIIHDSPSPNFHTTEQPRRVDLVVIHVMEGTMAATASWFGSPTSHVSAHYGVSKTGDVVRYVAEDNVAWHAGRVDGATVRLVLARPNLNPNSFSIGIEHEGDGTEDLTPAQRAATLELLADICARHGIPIDRDHIVAHREIYSLKTCPGAISVDLLVSQLAGAA